MRRFRELEIVTRLFWLGVLMQYANAILRKRMIPTTLETLIRYSMCYIIQTVSLIPEHRFLKYTNYSFNE